MTPSRPWLPLAAVAFTLLSWASAFVAIRHLGEEVPPGSLSLGRLVVAVAALGVMVLVSVPAERRHLPSRRERPLIALGGVSWIGIYNVALNESERRIDAGTAALIVQIGPIVVALLATFFFQERLTRWLVLGLGVGFAGVIVIGRASSSGGNGDVVGVLLAALAAVTFAVGIITQKKLLASGMTALEMTFWFYVVGTIACLPWSGELVGVVRDARTSDLVWILYLGIVPSALAFVTWAYALNRSDAGKFALSTFLVPFLTTLIAWLLLGEVPPALAFVGGALCIAGVLLTRRKSRVIETEPEPVPS